MLASLTALEPFVQHYGLPGLFLDVYLESMGLPLPGETLMMLAAALAGLGQLNIFAVAGTAFVAAVTGDNTGYLIGRRLGRPLVVEHGGRFGITHERLAKVESVIRRHGPLIVASARFVILFRQLNGLAAGTVGMNWLTFLAANIVGAALWVGFWTTLAYRFGKDASFLPALWAHLSWTGFFVFAAILVALIAGVLYFRRKPPADGGKGC